MAASTWWGEDIMPRIRWRIPLGAWDAGYEAGQQSHHPFYPSASNPHRKRA